MKQLENLIMNLSKYHDPKQLTESGKRQGPNLKKILTKSKFSKKHKLELLNVLTKDVNVA